MSIVRLECGRTYDVNSKNPTWCAETCDQLAKCMGIMDDALLRKTMEGRKININSKDPIENQKPTMVAVQDAFYSK